MSQVKNGSQQQCYLAQVLLLCVGVGVCVLGGGMQDALSQSKSVATLSSADISGR